jgi:hypothetical protein
VAVDVAGVELGPGGALLFVATQGPFATRYFGEPGVEHAAALGEVGEVGAGGPDLLAAGERGQPAAVFGQPGLAFGDPVGQLVGLATETGELLQRALPGVALRAWPGREELVEVRLCSALAVLLRHSPRLRKVPGGAIRM